MGKKKTHSPVVVFADIPSTSIYLEIVKRVSPFCSLGSQNQSGVTCCRFICKRPPYPRDQLTILAFWRNKWKILTLLQRQQKNRTFIHIEATNLRKYINKYNTRNEKLIRGCRSLTCKENKKKKNKKKEGWSEIHEHILKLLIFLLSLALIKPSSLPLPQRSIPITVWLWEERRSPIAFCKNVYTKLHTIYAAVAVIFGKYSLHLRISIFFFLTPASFMPFSNMPFFCFNCRQDLCSFQSYSSSKQTFIRWFMLLFPTSFNFLEYLQGCMFLRCHHYLNTKR